MTYTDLRNRFPSSYTKIQLEQTLKEYIGKEINIDTSIFDIEESIIKIGFYNTSDAGYPYFNEDNHTKIRFDKYRYKNQLQTFQKNESVKIIVKLINISFDHYHTYSFELLAIKKNEQAVVKPKEKITNEKDYGSLLYGCGGAVFFTYSIYKLIYEAKNGNWFHDVIGLWAIKFCVVFTFLFAVFFIYLYISSTKEKR